MKDKIVKRFYEKSKKAIFPGLSDWADKYKITDEAYNELRDLVYAFLGSNSDYLFLDAALKKVLPKHLAKIETNLSKFRESVEDCFDAISVIENDYDV